jgi:hypothetical protein
MREMEKNILLEVVKEFLVLVYKALLLDTRREF